jgi:hypothetical protein
MDLKSSNTLKEDFGLPLDKIHRHWIRVPATLMLTPIVVLVGIVGGVAFGLCKAWEDFIWDCLKGPKR